ncbi:winged helix DNA-binding domain-containing protein [Angustibacter peucedani]
MTRRSATTTLVAERLASQGLAGRRSTSATAVVDRLLAVQAQDPRGLRLAVRSRSTGLTAADVDTELTDERSLLVTWLHRGTLHLVAAADYWWLHPLTTPQLATTNRTRLRQTGVDERQAETGVQVVVDAVGEGPQTRDALRARLDDAGVPTAGQAFVHVLMAASLADDVVRGPVVAGEQAFVRAGQWLGPAPRPLDRDEELARLARRYLAGHAPADARDLAYWAGLTLGDARRGFAAVEDETAAVDGPSREAGGLRRLASSSRRVPAVPGPRLLGPFDPLLHGWPSREPVVGAHQGVVTSNGVFRPSALVDGRVVATWGLSGGVVALKPLEPLDDATLTALRRDARAVLAYLGLPPTDLTLP